MDDVEGDQQGDVCRVMARHEAAFLQAGRAAARLQSPVGGDDLRERAPATAARFRAVAPLPLSGQHAGSGAVRYASLLAANPLLGRGDRAAVLAGKAVAGFRPVPRLLGADAGDRVRLAAPGCRGGPPDGFVEG